MPVCVINTFILTRIGPAGSWLSWVLCNMSKSRPRPAIRRAALGPHSLPPSQRGSLVSYTPSPLRKRKKEKGTREGGVPRKRQRGGRVHVKGGPPPPPLPLPPLNPPPPLPPPSRCCQRYKLAGPSLPQGGQHRWHCPLISSLSEGCFDGQAFPTVFRIFLLCYA